MQPTVPGFVITGELSSSVSGSPVPAGSTWPSTSGTAGSTWTARRTVDGQSLVLRIVAVADVLEAQAQAAELRVVLRRIGNEHLVRLDGAIALADGTLALVLDQVTGGSLAKLLGGRGQLTAGETITTVAPLFGALADLHTEGVVHGDLGLGSVLFSGDGRPLIGDFGQALLVHGLANSPGGYASSINRAQGFVAPEVVAGAAPTSASDVYSMAALGWFCLTGAAPGSTRPSLPALRPKAPDLLVDILTLCLSVDPTVRPSAEVAAVEVFESAPAESVLLSSAADPASEITRRIRATAASAAAPETSSSPALWRLVRSKGRLSPERLVRPRRLFRLRRLRGLSRPMVIGIAALLVAVAIGGSASWFLARPSGVQEPVAAGSLSTPTISSPRSAPARSTSTAPTPGTAAPTTRTPAGNTDVVTASDSPRRATAGLLQALVDARSLAYATRNPALLDLVYAPGAAKAGVDRSNIDIALTNGATYIGLSFVVKDVAFLDGTSARAQVRATVVTPAYYTGQPDGRRVAHAQEILAPSVFTLSMTPDGWRILGLTAP